MALGTLYEGLPQLVDIFAEACMSYPITLTFVPPMVFTCAEDCIRSLLESAHDLHEILERLKYFGIIN